MGSRQDDKVRRVVFRMYAVDYPDLYEHFDPMSNSALNKLAYSLLVNHFEALKNGQSTVATETPAPKPVKPAAPPQNPAVEPEKDTSKTTSHQEAQKPPVAAASPKASEPSAPVAPLVEAAPAQLEKPAPNSTDSRLGTVQNPTASPDRPAEAQPMNAKTPGQVSRQRWLQTAS